LKSNTNSDFEILRIKSEYKRTISTEIGGSLTGDVSLITGKYILKWSDLRSNVLAFDVSENQHASIFAPVKKTYIPEYRLSDFPNYRSKEDYISKYYKKLPESKQVSRIGWGMEGLNMDFNIFSDYIAIPVFYGGVIVAIASVLSENPEQLAIGSIVAAVGFLSIPFYKKTETKVLKSNISKNYTQRQDIVNQYEELLIEMREDLKEKNRPVLDKNKKIMEYNRSLPPAEVTYEVESSN